jgi:hypothetical protein
MMATFQAIGSVAEAVARLLYQAWQPALLNSTEAWFKVYPPWPAGWALVELLGRYLFGDRLVDFAADPLWDVLAELDGRRSGTVPAVGFGPAAPVRLPRAWLERWPPPTPSYVARRHRDRLVIRHPQAGFVAADVPFTAGTFDEVRAAEAAWLRDVRVAAGTPAEPGNPAPPTALRRGRRGLRPLAAVFQGDRRPGAGRAGPGAGHQHPHRRGAEPAGHRFGRAGGRPGPGPRLGAQLGRIVLFHFLDAA